MRRVVAGAHGVDVVPLHQQHVVEHVLLGDGAAAVGVELVPVDPAQQHPPAVDGEQRRRRWRPCGTRRAATRLGAAAHRAVVEPGGLGAPRLARAGRDRSRPRRRRCPARARAPGRATPASTRSVPAPVGGRSRRARTRRRRRRPAGPAASTSRKMPGQPPHVLVLEVAARRTTGGPGPRARCRRRAGGARRRRTRDGSRLPWAVADLEAVQPRPQAASRRPRSAARASPAGQSGGERERAPVLAGGVLVGHPRRVDGNG